MKYSKTAPVKIIILGAGGTGGYVIPHLYRIAFAADRQMRIIVCDGDVVEGKNLIRQNFVEQDIGRNKAQVLAERYSAAFGDKTLLLLDSYTIRQTDIDRMFCDKDTFLSMFNPTYLTERLAEKGRALILKYLQPVSANPP